MQRVVVLGSSNVDLVVRGLRLPRAGETIVGGEFYRAWGGKGANQAVAAARLATRPVTFISAVGDDDFGAAMREGLRRENLDLTSLATFKGVATGVALIMVDEHGENQISVASGANAHLSADDIDRLDASLFEGPGVFLASLEVAWPAVLRGLERARRGGMRTILNPAPALAAVADRAVLANVDILIPNETEAAALSGVSADHPAEAARQLLALGCPAVIVTLGRAGVLLADQNTTLEIAAPRVEAIDTTAAGDAFSGALAVALAEGRELPDGASWATAAASISVTRRGAQPSLPYRAEMVKRSF